MATKNTGNKTTARGSMTSNEAKELIKLVTETSSGIKVIEERVENLKKNQSEGFDTINRRFGELDNRIKHDLEGVRAEYRSIGAKLSAAGELDGKLQRELEALQTRLNTVDAGVVKVLEEHKAELTKLKAEVAELQKLKEQGRGASMVLGFIWSAVGGGVVLGMVLLVKLLA